MEKIYINEKMSVQEIEEYLKMLIRLNSKSLKQKTAVQKWKRDLAFIEQKYADGSVQMSIGDLG